MTVSSPGTRRRWTVALLMAASPLLLGAFDPLETDQISREELVEKLSSDINKVDYTIIVTRALIKKSPDAPYQPELLLRLAELYVEKSRYIFARQMEQKPERERVLGSDSSLEVQLNKKLAIETYERILADFPEYERTDQVRFYRAHEFRELGIWDKMTEGYKELIEKHPKSQWAVEAQLILGDYHFDKGELDKSAEYYNRLLSRTGWYLRDLARYKLAWIRINQEKYHAALKLFEAAVSSKASDKRGAIGDARAVNAKREALLAMTWPYSEVRKAANAPAYFRRLAPNKTLYVAALKRLANRYYIKTKYADAALLYREVIRLSANVDENVEYLQRIYEATRNMSAKNPKRYAHAEADVREMTVNLARFRSVPSFPDADKAELARDFEIRARDLATRLHVDAQNKKNKEAANKAAAAYDHYLSVFRDPKQLLKIRLNYAEALQQGEDLLNAAVQYEAAAKVEKNENQQRDHLHNAVAVYYKAINEDTDYRVKNPTKQGLLNKLELLRAREGLKQIGAYYVQTWPKDKNTPAVKFNIARMYYQEGSYEKAAELFEAFVNEYPTRKDVATAGNLALDALRKLDKFTEMAALASKFSRNPKIADTGFKSEAAAIAKKATERQVTQTVLTTTEGNFSNTMLQEWEKHKGTKLGEDYLYTAFVKYKDERNIAGVFDFGGRIIGAYPRSKRITDVLATMGTLAVEVVDFERAAFMFEQYKQRFPRDKNADDLLKNAANIRYQLGDTESARRNLLQLRGSGNNEVRMWANETLIKICADAGDWSGLAAVAGRAASDFPRWAGAVAYTGIAAAEQGQGGQARAALARAVGMGGGSDFDRTALGWAQFHLGHILQSDFEHIQFSDAARAEQDLGRKLAAMQQLEQSYIGAINSGEPKWAIAALSSIATAYREMASFIGGAPMPDGLSGAQRNEYKTALHAEAKSYLAKADETMNACAQKADQLKVLSGYAKRCLTRDPAAPIEATGRRRSRGGSDEALQQELASLRAQLAKTPSNVRILEEIARRSMRQGDFHLARMTLLKAAESNPRNPVLQNLLGVSAWHVGEIEEALDAFEKARQQRHAPAAANMAALLRLYGHAKRAADLMRRVDLGSLNASSEDLHPSVHSVAEEIQGS